MRQDAQTQTPPAATEPEQNPESQPEPENETIEQQRSVGRPMVFQTVEELDKKIDQYFQSRDAYIAKTQRKVLKSDGSIFWQDDEELMPARPKTMAGLAHALDVDRKTLLNYKSRPEFFPSIARALAQCEEYAEEQLFVGRNAHGAQFALKNNYGWHDETEIVNKTEQAAKDLDALDDPAADRDGVADAAAKELDAIPEKAVTPQAEEPANDQPGPTPPQ